MVIAEIGLNHFGSIEEAKTLIRAANDSGADLIKSQAFLARDMKTGSMPTSFYEACQFTLQDYIDLIDYTRDLKNDLFFSIFSDRFESLKTKQTWHKITGAQTRAGKATEFHDHDNVIISVPNNVIIQPFKKANILHVTDYLTQRPNLRRISELKIMLSRDEVGYSDHTMGIDNCLKAIEVYGANIVEKHFTLVQDRRWNNQVFRDTIHGATPAAFQRIVLAMG